MAALISVSGEMTTCTRALTRDAMRSTVSSSVGSLIAMVAVRSFKLTGKMPCSSKQPSAPSGSTVWLLTASTVRRSRAIST